MWRKLVERGSSAVTARLLRRAVFVLPLNDVILVEKTRFPDLLWESLVSSDALALGVTGTVARRLSSSLGSLSLMNNVGRNRHRRC